MLRFLIAGAFIFLFSSGLHGEEIMKILTNRDPYLDYSYYWAKNNSFMENKKEIKGRHYIILEYSWTMALGYYNYILLDFDADTIKYSSRKGSIKQRYLTKSESIEVRNVLSKLSYRNNIFDEYNKQRVKDGTVYFLRYCNKGLKNKFGIYHLEFNDKEKNMQKERLLNIEIIRYIKDLVET
jgi:hypothetical protein